MPSPSKKAKLSTGALLGPPHLFPSTSTSTATPSPSKTATLSTAATLGSGLVDGRFPSDLFTAGYLAPHELQPFRAVCCSWSAAISRNTQPWGMVLAFLNSENRLHSKAPRANTRTVQLTANTCTFKYDGTYTVCTIAGDHRVDTAAFELLSPYEKAVAVIRFQKQCDGNLLKVYDEYGYSPGDYCFPDDDSCAGAELECSNKNR
jgi:hypothetical protein